MSIAYRIYSNHGTGGTVDYSAPLATVTSLSYNCGPLPLSSDTIFVVHAFDQVSLKEEANSDARIRLRLDGQGNDVTAQPNMASDLMIRPSLGGGGRVTWSFSWDTRTVAPTSFLLQLYRGQTTVASGRVPFKPGQIGYSFSFPGPLIPASYTAGLTVVGPGGLSSPPLLVSAALGLTSNPFVIDSLSIH